MAEEAAGPETSPAVDVTLVVCTFNRRNDLREMLETALRQDTGGEFTYEVLVVDNNSTDDTRAVVEAFAARGHRNLQYLFEARQGKSHALNAGLAAARGWIYTIVDDDFILPPHWLRKIVEGFRTRPDASFVSGKVLPLWQGDVPAWLGPESWSALALADYGDEELSVDERNPICLLACSFRRSHVEAVGGYRSELGVSRDLIGGVEDLELLRRLWTAARRGVYLPDLGLYHKVPPSRLTRRYHRRWHTGHGRFYARMREAGYERSEARLLDVPAHLYRQAATAAVEWLASWLRWQTRRAFECETRLRFFIGFFRERRQQYLARGGRGVATELASFAHSLMWQRLRGASERR